MDSLYSLEKLEFFFHKNQKENYLTFFSPAPLKGMIDSCLLLEKKELIFFVSSFSPPLILGKSNPEHLKGPLLLSIAGREFQGEGVISSAGSSGHIFSIALKNPVIALERRQEERLFCYPILKGFISFLAEELEEKPTSSSPLNNVLPFSSKQNISLKQDNHSFEEESNKFPLLDCSSYGFSFMASKEETSFSLGKSFSQITCTLEGQFFNLGQGQISYLVCSDLFDFYKREYKKIGIILKSPNVSYDIFIQQQLKKRNTAIAK